MTPKETTIAGTMSSHRTLLPIEPPELRVGEDRLVVLQPDVGRAVGVGERVVDRLERRVDEHERDEEQPGQQEGVGDRALGEPPRQRLDEHVEEVEEQSGAADPADDGEHADDELVVPEPLRVVGEGEEEVRQEPDDRDHPHEADPEP